jgi:hypothetical protein
MTRWGAPTASLIAVTFVTSLSHVAVHTQALTDTKPNLSGHWVLDGNLSEEPDEKLEQMDSADGAGTRGRGSGGSPGGRRGDMARIERAKALLRDPSRSLAIVHRDPKLSIVQENGDLVVFYTDNRKEKKPSQVIQTRWDGNRVVVERRLGGGVTVFETYEVRRDQNQMVVNKRLVTSMMGQDRTIAVRTVYDLSRAGQ